MAPFEDDPFFGGITTGESGPTAPAGDQGTGGNFFGGLLDLARQFVPGVNTAINLAGRITNLIGSIGGTRPAPGEVSAFGFAGPGQGSPPSLAAGMGDSALPEGPLEVPPIYRTNFIADTALYSGEEASLSTVGPISGMDLAIPLGAPTVPRTLLQWLKRIAIAYGPSVAQAVWLEYQKRRRAGQSGTLAKAVLSDAYPIKGRISTGRRRRMNPANVRALRRALRRVRGFKRVTRKVKGLGLWGHRGGKVKTIYRRARRGDLWDVEDAADEYDEAEDLGYGDYAPEFFREEEEED